MSFDMGDTTGWLWSFIMILIPAILPCKPSYFPYSIVCIPGSFESICASCRFRRVARDVGLLATLVDGDRTVANVEAVGRTKRVGLPRQYV